MEEAVHYAGELWIQRARGKVRVIFPGFAACCSGLKALRIAREKRHTYDVTRVTCARCVAAIDKAYGPGFPTPDPSIAP